MLETRPDPSSFPPVDADALHRMMDDVSAIGGGSDGSMTRLTLSAEDGKARDWLAAWMREAGLRVEIDPIGNMFGILDWAGEGAPLIMTGSHLDSQPNGGRFDGALGVVAACSAVQAVQRHVAETGIRPKVNLAIVNWTNEEGARFQPSLLGSGVNSGEHSLDFALARKDGAGIAVGDALHAIGYAGTSKGVVPDALIELHIEGGPELEKAGKRFAALTGFWGATKYRLAFIGRQAHTGPTPMAERKDALLAAAHVIADLRRIADEDGIGLHTSVGRLEVFPNSPNVVPAEAVLFIELRSADPDRLAAAEERLKDSMAAAAELARVDYEVRAIDRRRAGRFDKRLVDLATDTALALGHDTMHFDSIGGHDAIAMAPATSSIVVVVPSVGGVIHHPTEFTSQEDRLLGTQILAAMLWRFCVDGNVLED
jgi:N-carbamoyl-L-amino-acid hydrolase